MTTFDPDSPDFEDYPWDPFYGGGPGDMYDPAEIPAEHRADSSEGEPQS